MLAAPTECRSSSLQVPYGSNNHSLGTGLQRGAEALCLTGGEEDLQNMTKFRKQNTAMVQVCTANQAGQSCWWKIDIKLVGAKSVPIVARIAGIRKY